MELVKKSFSKWIISAIILVIGILCIVAGAASGEAQQGAYDGISMTIGISLIVVSSLSILVALAATIISKGKAPFVVTAIGSAVALALGILFVVDNSLGGTLIWLLLNFVPYLMLVSGSILAVDGILILVFGFVNKNAKEAMIAAIVEFVFAAITIVLGALMIGNDPVISRNAQIIIFGVILILYSLLICASTLLPLVGNSKTVIDVKVTEVNDDNTESTEENKDNE